MGQMLLPRVGGGPYKYRNVLYDQTMTKYKLQMIIMYDPHILHTPTMKTWASKRVRCQAYKKLNSYGLGGATGEPGGCPGHSSKLCLFLSTLTVTRWWTVFRLFALRWWCREGILWCLCLARWHSLARLQSSPTLSIVRLRMCLRNRDELANYKRFKLVETSSSPRCEFHQIIYL